MFAFDFSSKSIEVLEFKKPLFGRFTITALGKAELEETILKDGQVKDEDLLSQKILELLPSLNRINNSECLFNLPRETYFFKRLKVAADLNKELLKEEIENALLEETGEAVKNLFFSYSTIHKEELTQEVAVLAVQRDILDSYRRVFLQIGLTPVLCTSENFSSFQSLKEGLSSQGISAVLSVVDDELSLSFFDSFGPILDFSGKLGEKTLIKDFASARLQIEEEALQSVKKLIIGGEGLEFDLLTLEKKLDLPLALASETVAVLIKERTSDLSQVKLPTTLFAKTLGLMLAYEHDPKELNLITREMPMVKVERSKISPRWSYGEAGKDQRSKTQIKDKKLRIEEKDNLTKEKDTIDSYGDDNIEEDSGRPGWLFGVLKKVLIIGIILVILFLGFKGIKAFLGNKVNQLIDFGSSETVPTDIQPSPTPTPLEPTPTPSLTPTPILQRSDLKITILNGSGVRGAANNLSDYLKDLGYNVVKVGNAARYDYQKVEVSIKESKRNYLEQLKNDLLTKYSKVLESSVLPETDAFDAQIIVGKQ